MSEKISDFMIKVVILMFLWHLPALESLSYLLCFPNHPAWTVMLMFSSATCFGWLFIWSAYNKKKLYRLQEYEQKECRHFSGFLDMFLLCYTEFHCWKGFFHKIFTILLSLWSYLKLLSKPLIDLILGWS